MLRCLLTAVIIVTAPVATASAARADASICGELVKETLFALEKAGAPSAATNWQEVRDAAQNFVNTHPGTRTAAGLESLIARFDRTCAP